MKNENNIIKTKKYNICGIGNCVIDYFVDFNIAKNFIPRNIMYNCIKSNETCFVDRGVINKIDDFYLNHKEYNVQLGGAAFNMIYNSSILGLHNIFCTNIGNNETLLKYNNIIKGRNIKIIDLQTNAKNDCVIKNILISDNKKRLMLSSKNESFMLSNTLLRKILSSELCYIEGYIMDKNLLNFFVKYLKKIKQSNVKIAICLSNSVLIKNNRDIFNEFIGISDFIFGNRKEFIELCEGINYKKFMEDISKNEEKYFIEILYKNCSNIYKTTVNNTVRIFKTKNNTNGICNLLGVGDAFVSGFLYSFLRGNNMKTNSLIGNLISNIIMSKKTNLLID